MSEQQQPHREEIRPETEEQEVARSQGRIPDDLLADIPPNARTIRALRDRKRVIE